MADYRTRLRSWLPRPTVRLRLTLLYSGLFLVSGAALLTITYVLLTHRIVGGRAVLFSTNPSVLGDQGAAPTVGLGQFPPGLPPELLPPQSKAGYDPLHRLLIIIGLTLAAMLLLSIVLGWLVAGRVLRPLRTMTATTRQISEDSLHQRLAAGGPDDELKDLADTIDGLLARLDSAFDAQREALAAQRSFVANASHELRGPLTLERAALEIALGDPDADAASLRATCERVLTASRQQERLIDALLTLARGQRGLDQREPVDIAAIADEVVLARRAEIQRRELRVNASLDPAVAPGDARLAERLVVNLVDNAIRHNVPGGWLAITAATEGGRAVLTVVNSGPAVPPAEVDRLLRPFQRLGTERTAHDGGHGLGLSIVAAIAAAHNADLRVEARVGGGLSVRLEFGAAPRPLPAGGSPPAVALAGLRPAILRRA
jgi:signal transduction histidine kinase